MAKATALNQKRGVIQANLTRFENYLNNMDKSNPNYIQIRLRVVNVNPLLQEFNKIQYEIETLAEERPEVSEEKRKLFEDKYYEVLSEAETLIAKNDETERVSSISLKSESVRSHSSSGSSGNNPVVAGIGNLNQIRLPKINMPSFEGHYDQWLFFKDTYSSLVHTNDTISSIQKFQYLRLCLKGEARDVIKSLEVSSANYETAWELLVEQYEDKRLLVLNHVKVIFDLPSSARESHGHLRKLMPDGRFVVKYPLKDSIEKLGESKQIALRRFEKNDKENTKRTVLSVIARLFDPLGLLAPCVISAKILLQNIWQHNLSWDDSIPQELNESFERFKEQLPSLNKLEIKRHVICKDPIEVELHGFADASEAAYGAAIYVRSVDVHGRVYCNLLCAKSRVAPLKTLTIPRLELCAAFLFLNMETQKQIFWSDSTIVLAWIKTSPHLLKVFCAHRVTEIQNLTSVDNWHFIKTHENPADLLTRGIETERLIDNKLWWHGPKYLLEKSWSTCSDNSLMPEVNKNEVEREARKNKIALTIVIQKFEIFDRFSKFSKLQRVCAYCLRFKGNAMSKVENRVSGALTANELAAAINYLVKLAQTEMFGKELKSLRKDNQVNSNSKLLNLNPFLDANGIIRVGGRLKNSNFDFEKKHPIIVDAKHNLTTLLVKQEHERLLHAGPQAVLASLRDRIWVIAWRNLVRKITRSCVQCFKARPRAIESLMGNLPLVRVTESRPFINSGIDFAGPFLLRDRNGRKYNIIKAYVCVFVCLATKAIHLEVVSDLTTDAFMAAFHRFVSRRGHCSHVYSDNGTNFVGAQRRIERLQVELRERVDFENIQWHFIPPRAPHFGGIWEAGVKSFKTHLKRVLGDSKLNFEEFTTLLSQIEACLNSRPLYPLSNDPNDPSPLTPAHFLIGQPLTAVVEPQLCDARISTRRRFVMLQQMKQQFWSRWSKVYVSELQTRIKWKKNHQNLLKVGAVVIVKEDGVPPLKWILGRIERLHPGKDGVCRVVTLKTKTGTLKRAVTKVCVLPVPER